MAVGAPHLSLIAEPIFSIGTFDVTNSVFTSVIISAILIGFAAFVNSQLKHTDRPTGLQNFAEWIVESLYNFVHSITNDHKKTNRFLPFIATFFLFILLNNWFGLLPGVGSIVVPLHESAQQQSEHQAQSGLTPEVYAATEEVQVNPIEIVEEVENTTGGDHSPADAATGDMTHVAEATDGYNHGLVMVPLFRPGTADLNTTIALGAISIFVTQIFGFQYSSFAYFGKFLNFSSPIMFFVGIVEIISEFAKIISFAFRLFGNIFAGEVLLIIITYLAGLIVPMPFYGIELFVGFIQALVFSMISLVFFNMASERHAH